jgi:hypothetical protein
MRRRASLDPPALATLYLGRVARASGGRVGGGAATSENAALCLLRSVQSHGLTHSPRRPALTGCVTVPRKDLPRTFAAETVQPRRRQRARLNHPRRRSRRNRDSLHGLRKHRSPRVETNLTPEP